MTCQGFQKIVVRMGKELLCGQKNVLRKGKNMDLKTAIRKNESFSSRLRLSSYQRKSSVLNARVSGCGYRCGENCTVIIYPAQVSNIG